MDEHRLRGFVLREILGPKGGVTNINLKKNCIMRNFIMFTGPCIILIVE